MQATSIKQATSINNEDIQAGSSSAAFLNSRNINQFIYIRVIACIAIILLHTLFASNIYFADSITTTQLTATHTIEHLLMWAVPCFLMVTGALLLQPSREISTKKLFGKYIRRIALALVVFTFLFQLFDYIMGEESSLFLGWLSNLVQGHSWPHMWYLYLMLGIYLMLPFYKMVTDRASIRQIWMLVLIITVFVSILPLAEFIGLEDMGFYIPTTMIYPVYVFAGYALYEHNIKAGTAGAIFAVSTVLIIVLSVMSSGAGSDAVAFNYDLFGYDSILVVAQSLSLFSLMLRMKGQAGALIRSIDECSFGIYLIHMIGVVFIMKWVGFNPYTHTPIVSFALMVFVFFAVSYAATWLIRQIPKLNLL